jgi:branched-chain amino acid transport system ATP-binding protein
MTGTEVLLRCRGLSKSYGGVNAVTNADLEVRAGEIVGLVGPNGAGKTTLVDLIVGTQPADKGELTLAGKKLTGSPAKRGRAGLARTFQHPQLALELSVWDNLLVGAAGQELGTLPKLLGGMARGLVTPKAPIAVRERVRQIADELGVSGLDRSCADLTLGEMRLVEVARAILRQPSLVLLDEPFAGSDAHGVQSITKILRNLAKRGVGVLVVDHNVDIIAALVDRIVLMDQGRVLFDGDPAECMSSPQMQAVYFGTVSNPDGGAGDEWVAGGRAGDE